MHLRWPNDPWWHLHEDGCSSDHLLWNSGGFAHPADLDGSFLPGTSSRQTIGCPVMQVVESHELVSKLKGDWFNSSLESHAVLEQQWTPAAERGVFSVRDWVL